MDAKKIIAPLILFGLFAAFATISIIVFLQKGNRERWISRKLKLGAAILTITGLTNGCESQPVVTCYDPAPYNWFQFDDFDQNEYTVVANLPNDSVLTGVVYEPKFEKYAFEIIASDDSVSVQKGEIVALDGAFDEPTDSFKIELNSKLDTGSYLIKINTAGLSENYLVDDERLKID